MLDVYDVTNITSLVSSAATFLMMVVIGYYRPLIFNRVSLRFQRLVALIDFFRHLVILGFIQDSDSTFCKMISFLTFYLNHLYILVNCIAALNFYIIFYHVMRPDKRIERMLLVGAILFASILDSVPFLFDFYGRDSWGGCFINANTKYRMFFRVILLYVVQSAGMLFCLFIFFSVLKHLYHTRIYFFERFPDKTIILFGERIKTREFVIKLYRRVALYPLSCVICFLPYIADCLSNDIFKYCPEWLSSLSHFSLCFAGTLNLIALLFDPHFQLAIKSIHDKGIKNLHVSKAEFEVDVDLHIGEEQKEDQECLVEVHNQESIEFRDLIRFV